MKTIAEFKIDYLQYLNSNNEVVTPFPAEVTDEVLVRLYKQMVLTRAFDTKAVNLQRTGKLGTYPAATGHEAAAVGIGYSMAKSDVLCPYYRDQGTSLMRGVKMSEILAYWGGDERGSDHANNREDLPVCVPIATQCLHACGVAYAIKLRQQQRATVTTIGDGGTSKGDFYEALNVAGCWQLPVVFVALNNQWAISVPRHKQTASKTIAQKAIAAGMQGMQIDGNDIVAVISAMQQALERARNGDGPTLIEMITYRLSDHTTADDATRYREAAELETAWQQEPILRLRRYLESKQLWSEDKETNLNEECHQVIDQAVNVYLNQKPQAKTDMIDFLYAELPQAYLEQRDQIEDFSK